MEKTDFFMFLFIFLLLIIAFLYGSQIVYCFLALIFYCKHDGIRTLGSFYKRKSKRSIQSNNPVQPVQPPIVQFSHSGNEQGNTELRNNTENVANLENLRSFIQNSLNAASEASQRFVPNLQNNSETNNQIMEQSNEKYGNLSWQF